MESLAYLHLALAHDEIESSNQKTQKRPPLLSGSQSSLILMLVLLTSVGMTSEALAQRLIQLGDRGGEVAQIQQRLRELGYFNQAPTSYYGTLTQDAVIRFQRDYNLRPDGIVGSSTRNALFNARASLPQPPPPPRVAPLQIPEVPTVSPVSTVRVTDTQILQRGDRGPQVLRLQQALFQRGYNPGPQDGAYGNDTEFAVRQFQERQRLRVDGIAGTETLAALGLLQERQNTGNPYVVVIPITNNNLLSEVRRYFSDAFLANSRLGAYIQAGSFANQSAAESRSYALRARGFDARVVYF